MHSRFATIVVMTVMLLSLPARAAEPELPAFTDPEAAGSDYAIQGEYVGKLPPLGDQQASAYGVQIVANGDIFTAAVYRGGLPGAGWDQHGPQWFVGTRQADGSIPFFGDNQVPVVMPHGDTHQVKLLGVTLPRVTRTSPTLGAKPPEGAVVLFDGKNLDHFVGDWIINDEGSLLPHSSKQTPDGKVERHDLITKDVFGDFTLHVEFRTPFMPTAQGQDRGNSGVYLQDHYECQVLDSFGLSGEDNECGGLYEIRKPDVNMCLPPLVWQTYDIDFTPPEFAEGKKTANARVTVRHNGVPIHKDVEIPHPTKGGADGPESATGPIKLQDHGNPVQYRNIWVVKKS